MICLIDLLMNWLILKDNIDSPAALDREGLELAFKYFSSHTLTMRLCGINQGNPPNQTSFPPVF